MKIDVIHALAFKELYEEIKNKTLPIKTAYKFSKIIRAIDNELIFFQDRMKQLMEKYGKKDENGQFILTNDQKGIQIQEDKISACKEETQELYNLAIDVRVDKFKLEELISLEVTAQDMQILSVFIED